MIQYILGTINESGLARGFSKLGEPEEKCELQGAAVGRP